MGAGQRYAYKNKYVEASGGVALRYDYLLHLLHAECALLSVPVPGPSPSRQPGRASMGQNEEAVDKNNKYNYLRIGFLPACVGAPARWGRRGGLKARGPNMLRAGRARWTPVRPPASRAVELEDMSKVADLPTCFSSDKRWWRGRN